MTGDTVTQVRQVNVGDPWSLSVITWLVEACSPLPVVCKNWVDAHDNECATEMVFSAFCPRCSDGQSWHVMPATWLTRLACVASFCEFFAGVSLGWLQNSLRKSFEIWRIFLRHLVSHSPIGQIYTENPRLTVVQRNRDQERQLQHINDVHCQLFSSLEIAAWETCVLFQTVWFHQICWSTICFIYFVFPNPVVPCRAFYSKNVGHT